MTTKRRSLDALFGRRPACPPEVLLAAQSFLRCQKDQQAARAALTVANTSLRRAEEELLRQLDQAGQKTVTVEGVELTAAQISHYRLVANALDDREVMTWLLRQGGHDLVKHTVDVHLFSGFCRQLVLAGKPILNKVRRVIRRYIRTGDAL